MSSLAVKLPLTRNSIDGFTMIKDLKTLVNQNLKMLVLTNPGERVMDPEYGVGLSAYLFSNYSTTVFVNIEKRIKRQAEKYLPLIVIERVDFEQSPEVIDSNVLAMRIVYTVPALNVAETLEITI